MHTLPSWSRCNCSKVNTDQSLSPSPFCNSAGRLHFYIRRKLYQVIWGSACNLNPHLHILCLDGVFSEVGEGESKAVKFRNVPTLSDLGR